MTRFLYLHSYPQAAYQESGKCVTGHPNYILLLHKGRELPDEKSLAELGITEGDVLVHIDVRLGFGFSSFFFFGSLLTVSVYDFSLGTTRSIPTCKLQATRAIH